MTATAEAGEDDRVLVARALDERPGAFATLVRRYERLVAALVARTAHRADTEDLVQDVFLEAYSKLDTIRDPGRFKGWLVQVALNRARLQTRRRRTEKDALVRAARPEAKLASGRLERAEEKSRLLEAIGTLPEATRAVVTLRYLEGRSAQEIAETLDSTPEAVRMRLSRGLAELRERLGKGAL